MSDAAPITSLRNPKVLDARKLLRRSVRERTGTFLIEGPLAVAEALRTRAQVRDIFLTETASQREELTRLAAAGGIPVTIVSEPVLK
ncbi:MAG: RNA methyltransferase substrate-binding domain-containing protein, partial [Actinomycetota bacterium]